MTELAGGQHGASDSGLAAALLAVAALAVAFAIQAGNGTLGPEALVAVTVAILATGAALLVPRVSRLGEGWREGVTLSVLGLGLAWEAATLLTSAPGMYLRLGPEVTFFQFAGGVGVASVAAGALLFAPKRAGGVLVLALVAAHLYLGLWLLRASPQPHIDVYLFHHDALEALLHGTDPYTLTFPNIYGPQGALFYGPGLVVDGRLQVGFPYPPLSLILALPGHLLAGDYRYGNLVAMEAAALFMAFARSGRVGRTVAAVFLLTPRVFFVIEQGWTEAYVVLLLAACVFVACRRPGWLPWALGLLLAVKQHLVLVLGFAHLLWPGKAGRGEHLRRLGKSVALAAAITLPWALWNLPGFWRSIVMFQIRQPFRAEALSYLAEIVRLGGPQLPSALAFALAVAGVVGVAWAARRTPAGFSAGVAFVYLLFFAFNKQAFCNYYYFVFGALCGAVAAARGGAGVEQPLSAAGVSTEA